MLNKQGSGKIDWTDFTWNPVSGCKKNCEYCYMQRMVKRGFDMTPKFHAHKIEEPLKIKEPSKFFVSSSGDLFGSWVPDEWIDKVFQTVNKCPQHIFQFLTKNPIRYWEYRNPDLDLYEDHFDYPTNAWLGMTIDTQKSAENLPTLTHSLPCKTVFISFEPLLEEITCSLKDIDWIIIGANSNPGASKPKKEWVEKLIKEARKNNTAIWIKENLNWPEKIKEWPKAASK